LNPARYQIPNPFGPHSSHLPATNLFIAPVYSAGHFQQTIPCLGVAMMTILLL
jgi:hypothetical protein